MQNQGQARWPQLTATDRIHAVLGRRIRQRRLRDRPWWNGIPYRLGVHRPLTRITTIWDTHPSAHQPAGTPVGATPQNPPASGRPLSLQQFRCLAARRELALATTLDQRSQGTPWDVPVQFRFPSRGGRATATVWALREDEARAYAVEAARLRELTATRAGLCRRASKRETPLDRVVFDRDPEESCQAGGRL